VPHHEWNKFFGSKSKWPLRKRKLIIERKTKAVEILPCGGLPTLPG
jgi:hypothetical protein